jgi:hypothetical protein
LLIEFEFVSYSSVPFFFSLTSITLIIHHLSSICVMCWIILVVDSLVYYIVL